MNAVLAALNTFCAVILFGLAIINHDMRSLFIAAFCASVAALNVCLNNK